MAAENQSTGFLGWFLAHPWFLLLLGIIDVGVVTFLKHQKIIDDGIAPEIFKEIGLAIAIVGFVTWSVERARVKVFTNELSKLVDDKLTQIKETTTDAIRQGPLPRAYYEQVSQTMFLSDFFRNEWIVNLELNWCKDEGIKLPFKNEFVNLAIKQEYRIKNISGVPQKYKIDHYESCDWDDKIPGATSFDYVRARFDNKNDFAVNTDAEAQSPWHMSDDEGIRFSREIEIPSGGVLKVWVSSRKLMRVGQYESRLIGEPTDGVLFQITGPEDLSVDLEVPEILLGSLRGQLKVSSKSKGNGSTLSIWQVARPLPPAACIFINWKQMAEGKAPGQSNGLAPVPPQELEKSGK